MAAEIEEVVLHSHLVDFEQFLPDFGHHPLHLAAGSHIRQTVAGRRRLPTANAAVPFVDAGEPRLDI